ncbi:MAG: hypothetical protein HRT53_20745 [Colwellia sp.]|nr:hypothetical protein [Colwellia sp.]
MFFDLLSQPEVATTISIIIMLCFVGAFFCAYKNWRNNPSVFITSLALAANFVIANNALYEILGNPEVPTLDFYLKWVEYNSLTIIFIILSHLILRVKHHKLSVSIMYLLLVNIIAYLSMHIDIILNGNREAWWLWHAYTPVVNFTELLIAGSVIIYSVKQLAKNNKTIME